MSFLQRKLSFIALLVGLSIVLTACSSSHSGRYSQAKDSAPTFEYGAIEYVEPTPVFEEYYIWTSKPYEINGTFYTPMITGKGFEQEGYASWYGQKFHGHTTANGEIFDMFALTAAHTTLPIPSYVQVTNLENGKKTIVRVNDRGPFHSDRILDLSYAAAKKLGFKDKGVAKIQLKVIHVDEDGVVSIGKEVPEALIANESPSEQFALDDNKVKDQTNSGLSKIFVQVLAATDAKRIKDLAKGIGDLLQLPTHTQKQKNIYKLQLGPLESEQSAKKVIQDLEKIGFDNAFTVELAPQ